MSLLSSDSCIPRLLRPERAQGFTADPVYAKGEVFAYVGLPQNLKDLSSITAPKSIQGEISLLTTYWSGSTDGFGLPASLHGRLNPPFQVALYLPS